MQANITYDDYLQLFYPYQKENVFTHNNWTLSNELMEIVRSNFFYAQHVRWNAERYGRYDTNNEIDTADNNDKSSSQVSLLNNFERTIKIIFHSIYFSIEQSLIQMKK